MPSLVRRLNITNQKVQSKADEIARMIGIKFNNNLGKGRDVCRTAIAVELACRLCNETYDPASIASMSGAANPKIYREAFSSVENMLNFKTSSFTLRELAVMFGGMRIVEFSEGLLETYKARVLPQIYPVNSFQAN